MTITANDAGNFCIRLGYITAALKTTEVQTFLIANGATAKDIDKAYEALLKVAGAFYQLKGSPE